MKGSDILFWARTGYGEGGGCGGDGQGLRGIDAIVAEHPHEHLGLVGPAGCEHRSEGAIHQP